MSFIRTKIRQSKLLSVIVSVVVSVLFVITAVEAATTISTNIVTSGTLDVTGLSTFIQASSTRLSVIGTAYFGATATSTFDSAGNLTAVGLATFIQASSTRLSVHDTAYFGGTATTSINSAGLITLTNGETIGNTTDGDITFTADNVVLIGNASSSAITVGDESVPTINGLSFGYCNFTDVGVTASSTEYFDCTTNTASALSLTDRVFVQATSSFDAGFIIEAASTTGVSTINIRVLNISGILGVPDTTLGGTSLNFWAVR